MTPNLPPSITIKNNLASTLKAYIKQNSGKNISEKQINTILQRVAKFDAERDKGTRAGGSIFGGGSKYFGGGVNDFKVMQGQKIQFSAEEYNAIFEGFIEPIKTSENTKKSLSVEKLETEIPPVTSKAEPKKAVTIEQTAVKSPLEILSDTQKPLPINIFNEAEAEQATPHSKPVKDNHVAVLNKPAANDTPLENSSAPAIPVVEQEVEVIEQADIKPEPKSTPEIKQQPVIVRQDESPELHLKEEKNEATVLRNSYSLGNISSPFSQETIDMLYNNTNVHTNFLKNANKLLGTVEYKNQTELTSEEKQRTQSAIIGRYGTSDHQWCAHAVSTIAEQSGINIGGHKAQVQQFINWGKANGIYNPISNTDPITKSNFETVREARANDISKQISDMKEGDLIIWKSRYAAKTNEGLNFWNASHIGIIESADLENGTVTVLEGNANVPRSDDSYERYIVRNASQRLVGDQVNGEPEELNRTDGLIRKVYTIQDLANFGYSGYINMQSLV